MQAEEGESAVDKIRMETTDDLSQSPRRTPERLSNSIHSPSPSPSPSPGPAVRRNAVDSRQLREGDYNNNDSSNDDEDGEGLAERVNEVFSALSAAYPDESHEESSGNDLERVAKTLERCYQLAQRYYLSCRSHGRSSGLRDGAPLPPTLHDAGRDGCASAIAAAWARAADSVMIFLCHRYRVLMDFRYRKDELGVVTRMRPAELAYVLYLKCAQNAHGGSAFAWRSDLRGITARDIPYVAARRLTRSFAPISSYSVCELMMALMQLDTVWTDLTYSDELVRYLELLEMRLADVLSEPELERVHNVECFRTRVAGQARDPEHPDRTAPLYVASDELVTQAALRGLAFHRALHLRAIIPVSPLSAAMQAPDGVLAGLYDNGVADALTEHMMRELRGLAQRLNKRDVDTGFRKNVLAMQLQPSEPERYALLGAGSASGGRASVAAAMAAPSVADRELDPENVLKTCRDAALYAAAVTLSKRTLLATLDATESSDTPDEVREEEGHLFTRSLALIALLDKVVYGTTGVRFSDYVYTRWFIFNPINPAFDNMDAIRDSAMPALLQTFNSFYFYYDGRQYETNDFTTAALAWFWVVARRRGARSEDNAPLDRAYEKLFGRSWCSLFGVSSQASRAQRTLVPMQTTHAARRGVMREILI